ncbi:DUF4136 domain-containing protein [Algoriphagus namhaensis]
MQKSLFTFLILGLITTACFTSKDYVTEYDYNYQGSFKNYKTFAFVIPDQEDSLMVSSILNSTIGARLGSQGFKEKTDKPDMLVSYKIFTDSIRYRGYVQPELDYWLQRTGYTYRDENGDLKKEQEKDETYNMIKYSENSGMLVIYVIDNRQGTTIWQGYTAAALNPQSPDFHADLTRAAYRVMNEFKIVNKYGE